MIINGNLDLTNSSIKTLEAIEEVKGNLYLFNCYNLISLGKIKKIDKILGLAESRLIESLGELEYVGDFLDITHCKKLKDLGKLKKVENYIFVYNSGLTDKYLETLPKDLYLKLVLDDPNDETIDWKSIEEIRNNNMKFFSGTKKLND